jgi:DNA-binding LacI/PurR family transcriptional regulator
MRYTDEKAMEMSLFCQTKEFFNDVDLPKLLSRRRVNAVLVINASDDSQYLQALTNESIPFCTLQNKPSFIDAPSLKHENEDSVKEGAEHLIQLGHKNIAYINGLSDMAVGKDRLAGIEKALSESDLKLKPDLIFSAKDEAVKAKNGYEFGYLAINVLIRSRKEFSAVITSSNAIATGALRALKENGIAVPKQCSIISCDDAPEASYLNPPLSCIKFSDEELGYAGAKWVHQMTLGTAPKEYPFEMWMKSQIILRKSTGRCL